MTTETYIIMTSPPLPEGKSAVCAYCGHGIFTLDRPNALFGPNLSFKTLCGNCGAEGPFLVDLPGMPEDLPEEGGDDLASVLEEDGCNS